MAGKTFNKHGFILFLITFFLAFELLFLKIDYANTNPSFIPNDYGKIIYNYNTTLFNKAIFGNSTAIAAIRDDLLPEGYGNLGIAYGKMTDFEKMLKMKFIQVNDEVILTANYLSFLDPLETNDTYPWHRQAYVPYVFFNRKATNDYIKASLKNLISGEFTIKITIKDYYFEKAVSKGHMDDQQLAERILSFEERFGHYTIEDFSQNIQALKGIHQYCEAHHLKLRFVWMPVNPKYDPRPEYTYELEEIVNSYLEENNIEYMDYTNAYPPGLFFDLGHINWEEGSYIFTEDFVQWLNK